MTIKPLVAWYDLWIGIFIDKPKRRIYIFPVPCLGIRIDLKKGPQGMFDDIVIPFGAHKGKRLIDCPVSYLDWLFDQSWVREPLKSQIAQHLRTSRKEEWEALSDE